MKVWVNGEERTFSEGFSVRHLIADLKVNPDGVAVAVNQEVVPRSRQEQRILLDGDRVEVIRAVGGG